MSTLDRFLDAEGVLHVAADGQMTFAERGSPSGVLLPGSFDPVHRGHWQLAQVAGELLGRPIAFELSVANVDKPSLTGDAIRGRLAPFQWQASVWLTHAARFVRKAELFPDTTFVVGADTALRIVAPSYYGNDANQMMASLKRVRELGCRFLVACRVDARGKCMGLEDVPIPASHRALFSAIPAERFRWDISSSALRAGQGQM